MVQSLLTDLQTTQNAAKKVGSVAICWVHFSKGVFMKVAVRKLGFLPSCIVTESIPESLVEMLHSVVLAGPPQALPRWHDVG